MMQPLDFPKRRKYRSRRCAVYFGADESLRSKVYDYCYRHKRTLAAQYIMSQGDTIYDAILATRSGDLFLLSPEIFTDEQEAIDVLARAAVRGVKVIPLGWKINVAEGVESQKRNLLSYRRAVGRRRTRNQQQRLEERERRPRSDGPIGKRRNKYDPTKWEDDIHEQQAIEMCRKLRDKGLSLAAIARHMNENNIWKRGTPWYHVTVSRILERIADDKD